MAIGWIFISITLTVLWCLGWYTVTDEGQALHFIRRLFTKEIVHEINLEKLKTLHPSEQQKYRQIVMEEDGERIVLYTWTKKEYPWYGKPIVTCVKCLPSVHGTFIYWFLVVTYQLDSGNPSMLVFWVINCVSASFLNDYFYTKRKSL